MCRGDYATSVCRGAFLRDFWAVKYTRGRRRGFPEENEYVNGHVYFDLFYFADFVHLNYYSNCNPQFKMTSHNSNFLNKISFTRLVKLIKFMLCRRAQTVGFCRNLHRSAPRMIGSTIV